VRTAYCDERGIDVNRRITGGGAIFFDSSQLGWEIVCGKDALGVRVADTRFFERACRPVVRALRALGVDAAFRPRNDIEVAGRKISGTGGTEEGDAFLFQGTLLVDFDADTMYRALRIPVEKLKEKELESALDRVTWLSRELGRVPPEEELIGALKDGFEEELGITLVEGGLTEEEERLFLEKLPRMSSPEWVHKVRLPGHEQPTIHSLYKSPGGLIRTSLVVSLKGRRIVSALIAGDFFAYPARAVMYLEAALKDAPADLEAVSRVIREFFDGSGASIPGVTPDDMITAVGRALEKMRIAESGIPLELTGQIIPVNGSFHDIMASGPRHLLLPYCAKSGDCAYRYTRECTECGDCTTGEAYELGHERNLWVTTILSFEDLKATLEDLRSQGVRSYVGCCCEAFYLKHAEDFEASGLPGVLLDIENTTCYELGQEHDAYIGKFESRTDLNLDLLRRVMALAL